MIPKKLDMVLESTDGKLIYPIITLAHKVNQIIDHLSDPENIIKAYNDLLDRQHEGEAGKGECLYGDADNLEQEKLDIRIRNTKLNDYIESKRASKGAFCNNCGKEMYLHTPMCPVKEPNPPEHEEEWLLGMDFDKNQRGFILAHIRDNFVSKNKIKKVAKELLWNNTQANGFHVVKKYHQGVNDLLKSLGIND